MWRRPLTSSAIRSPSALLTKSPRPTGEAWGPRNFLIIHFAKAENCAILSELSEKLPPRETGRQAKGGEKKRARGMGLSRFEHNPRRELKQRKIFLFGFVVTH
jgi:hypothetical protein